jgi:hypothetical protein
MRARKTAARQGEIRRNVEQITCESEIAEQSQNSPASRAAGMSRNVPLYPRCAPIWLNEATARKVDPSPCDFKGCSSAKGSGSYDLMFQCGQLPRHIMIRLHIPADFSFGVEDGCVIPTTEIPADLFQAVAGVTSGEIHADLTRE